MNHHDVGELLDGLKEMNQTLSGIAEFLSAQAAASERIAAALEEKNRLEKLFR